MREDPIISGGLFKLLLVLLVAAGLGIGAFAIAGGGVDIDLPDLPEVDSGQVTNIETPTNLQDTTIGEEPGQPSLDPFTTAGFAAALDAVRGEAGSGAQLTRLFVNGTQTQFIVRRGEDGAEAYSVRADSGELVREDATITVSGNATLDDFAFPLAGVKADAIDRMLAAARKQSGAGDFEPTVLDPGTSDPLRLSRAALDDQRRGGRPLRPLSRGSRRRRRPQRGRRGDRDPPGRSGREEAERVHRGREQRPRQDLPLPGGVLGERSRRQPARSSISASIFE